MTWMNVDLLQAFISEEDLEDMEEFSKVTSWPKEMRETGEAKCGADNLQDKWTGTLQVSSLVFRDDGGGQLD